MGLFFGKRVKKKSSKPFIVLKILLVIISLFILVMSIINDFDFLFRWLFILFGINSIIDGIEGYFQKEDKRFYLLDFGFGVLYLLLSFQFDW
jgi:uncharacterized membrane protein HdeD (DUF308 family)